MQRRDFLVAANAVSLVSGASLYADQRAPGNRESDDRMVGIQIAPVSLLDEGVERCLDNLQARAAINTLFIYSQTYHAGTKPKNVLAADHGIPVRDFRKSRLPHLWVRHRKQAFAEQVVQHERPSSNLEYGDRDVFKEIQRPAERRGMKVYARILEADARRQSRIPGYQRVLTVDHQGRPGHGPCWNNPHYRKWVYATVRELVTDYEIDGFQYGAERTGPLSNVLYRGLSPTCFCAYCVKKNEQLGIDAERARSGLAELYKLMKGVAALKSQGKNAREQAGTADGVLSAAMRTLYRHPEVLSWDYQWFQADHEICSEVHRIAKRCRPGIDSGRHVDHQRSSWDFFYRSATSYREMAEHADFIKPIVYHESMGPRLRWWVLDRLQHLALNDLSLEQSLQLYYGLFGHDDATQPKVDELDRQGLGPEYVYREIRRCKQSVGSKAKVYAGIGIDVPWYVPGGMEPRPSDPLQLETAVRRALDAGADGLLASREYNEMRMSSLVAFGKGVRG